MVKEKLDKFILDENKGFISKLIKVNENEDLYILYELDFYPVKVYEKSFGIMVRTIEKAKLMYDKYEEYKKFIQLPEKEQNKINKKKEKEKENRQKRIHKCYEEMDKLNMKKAKEQIPQEDYIIKLNEIHEKYQDLFKKKEKDDNTYEVDITMDEFKDNLFKYKNTLIKDKEGEIKLYPRYKTFKEIKDDILSRNKPLKEKKFDIYYFIFDSKNLLKPEDDTTFSQEGIESEDFINIIVDIHNEEGKNFNQLLKDKEKEKLEEEWDFLKENKETEKSDKQKKDKKSKKKLFNKVDNNVVKELEKEDKLEKEKLENEKKEKEKKEKEEKERLKKEQEKLRKEEEKIKKEKEKKLAKEEKERKEREKKLQKERERKLQRKKELEPFRSPPYGINNYGNTCYFNSVNQIFLNLPILQQLFLDPKIVYFINRTNKLGHKGKFFDIYKSL